MKKNPIIRILYNYRLNAIAKYWYLKIKEDKEVPKKNSIVYFNRRNFVDEKF